MKTHKRILAMLMSLVMVFTIFAVAMIPASAADAGEYTVRVKVYTDTYCDNIGDDAKFVVNYQSDNGTGSSTGSYTYFGGLNDYFKQGNDKKDMYTSEQTISGFPTSLGVRIVIPGKAFWGTRSVKTTITLQVKDNNGPDEWVDLATTGQISMSLTGGGLINVSDKVTDTTKTVDLSLYPYVESATFIGVDSVDVGRDYSSVKAEYSVVNPVDQYGVAWTNPTPSSWTTDNAGAVVSANGSNATVTFSKNPGDNLDYYNTLSAKWPSANPNAGSATYTTRVRVPHVITINPNGGIYNGTTDKTTEYKYTGEKVTLGVPTLVGHSFVNWIGYVTVNGGYTFTVENADSEFIANWEKLAPADWSGYDTFLAEHSVLPAGDCYTAESRSAYDAAVNAAKALKANFDADEDQTALKYQSDINAAVNAMQAAFYNLVEDHAYGEWIVDNVATCAATGSQHRVCATNPEHVDTAVIAKNYSNHVGETTKVREKEATCEEDGYTGDIVCVGCGQVKVIGEKISASGSHKFGDWTITEATCDTAGKKERTCDICGTTVTEAIPALGHVDADGDGICDNGNDSHEMPAAPSTPGTSGGSQDDGEFRCTMCDGYELNKDIPVIGIIITIVHFFVHFIQSIGK